GWRARGARAVGVVHLGGAGVGAAQRVRLAEPGDPEADELHSGHLGQHPYEPLLHDLEADQRLAELAPLPAVREGRIVGAHGVPERRERDGHPGRGEDLGGYLLKGVRARQTVPGWNAHAVQLDVGLPDRANAALALDHPRLEPGTAALDQKALDLAILHVPGPYHHDIGDAAVADPPLGAVDHVLIPLAARRRLERNRVGPVVGLGQRERAQAL